MFPSLVLENENHVYLLNNELDSFHNPISSFGRVCVCKKNDLYLRFIHPLEAGKGETLEANKTLALPQGYLKVH